MYGPDKYSQYNSPYAGGGMGDGEEGIVDKLRYFFEDHGKKIIVVIILLIVGFFVWDFFIGSYRTVTLEIANTEGETIGGDLSITRVGENRPTYEGPPTTVSLRVGSYLADATSSGYRFQEDISFTVSEESQTESFALEKALVTEISQYSFPQQLYLGQTETATITLYNPGNSDETIDLVFEGDFEDLMDRGFSMTASPSNILVPSKESITITLNITVSENIELDDDDEGDSKNGLIRIKFTENNDAQQEISFLLLPQADIEVSPSDIEETIRAGADSASLDTIDIENNSSVSAENITITVELDPTAPPEAEAWFEFDTILIASLPAGSSKEVYVYISPPINPNTLIIAGQSHIVVRGGTWEYRIPLNITIEGVTTALIADLSPDEIDIGKQDNGDFEIRLGEVEIENDGDLPIQNIEVLNYNASCRGDWIIFDQPYIKTVLVPNESWLFTFQITAPPAATLDQFQTCQIKIRFDDPITGIEKIQDTTPGVMRITPTE
ncbi:hypothetical protein KJ972_02945 [Candidatus Micrarchaeota archaeon]|nr:hypothetical protein [Candidatus Micrarchaeota archaeon]